MIIIKDNSKKTNKFNKIIYFDEDSATDSIYMSNQCALREELIREKSTSIQGNLSSEGGLERRGIIKSLLIFKD